ncbi:MAG: tetratricopeptide repeat protein [Spirochaetales bacterium]|nr:tetratricopeptide repeat protein [Spirochaetales bacterium]
MPAKLLVIDNNSPLLHSWKKGLAARYRVIEALGGVEAVRKLTSETIELVIANISLRTLNGVEAIGKIRSRFDRIPIIVLHNPKDVLDLKQAKAYSVDSTITLPVDYKKLIAEIERLLPAASAAKSARQPHAGSSPARGAAQKKAAAARTPGEAPAAAPDMDVEKRFYDGLSAISANNLPEAIAVFESLIKLTRLKKESWRRYLDDALFQLGQCHAAAGRYEKSNGYYKAFIAKAPHNLSYKSALLYLGKNYIALKNNAKAAVYLKQVINTPPFDSFGTQARKLLKTIETAK